MRTKDFKFKAAPPCMSEGCYNPVSWVGENDKVGLCMECYHALEEREQKLLHNLEIVSVCLKCGIRWDGHIDECEKCKNVIEDHYVELDDVQDNCLHKDLVWKAIDDVFNKNDTYDSLIKKNKLLKRLGYDEVVESCKN